MSGLDKSVPLTLADWNDLLSRCDSIHDFQRGRNDNYAIDFDKADLSNVLDNAPSFELSYDSLHNRFTNRHDDPMYEANLETILRGTSVPLICIDDVFRFPQHVKDRVSTITMFEPRVVAFFEMYFNIADIDIGLFVTGDIKAQTYDDFLNPDKRGDNHQVNIIKVNDKDKDKEQCDFYKILNICNPDKPDLHFVLDTTRINLDKCSGEKTMAHVKNIASDWDAASKPNGKTYNQILTDTIEDENKNKDLRCIYQEKYIKLVRENDEEFVSFDRENTTRQNFNDISRSVDKLRESMMNKNNIDYRRKCLDYKRSGDALQVKMTHKLNNNMCNNITHFYFATIDHLAFLKARLYKVPVVFTSILKDKDNDAYNKSITLYNTNKNINYNELITGLVKSCKELLNKTWPEKAKIVDYLAQFTEFNKEYGEDVFESIKSFYNYILSETITANKETIKKCYSNQEEDAQDHFRKSDAIIESAINEKDSATLQTAYNDIKYTTYKYVYYTYIIETFYNVCRLCNIETDLEDVESKITECISQPLYEKQYYYKLYDLYKKYEGVVLLAYNENIVKDISFYKNMMAKVEFVVTNEFEYTRQVDLPTNMPFTPLIKSYLQKPINELFNKNNTLIGTKRTKPAVIQALILRLKYGLLPRIRNVLTSFMNEKMGSLMYIDLFHKDYDKGNFKQHMKENIDIIFEKFCVTTNPYPPPIHGGGPIDDEEIKKICWLLSCNDETYENDDSKNGSGDKKDEKDEKDKEAVEDKETVEEQAASKLLSETIIYLDDSKTTKISVEEVLSENPEAYLRSNLFLIFKIFDNNDKKREGDDSQTLNNRNSKKSKNNPANPANSATSTLSYATSANSALSSANSANYATQESVAAPGSPWSPVPPGSPVGGKLQTSFTLQDYHKKYYHYYYRKLSKKT
jgi:hypothetical protein